MKKEHLNIAMIGHKHMLGREGGVEIVVRELSTRMAELGHHVVCYDRADAYVCGEKTSVSREYKGVKIIPVWTIPKKGFAAMTSSFSAAVRSSLGNSDIVHIHAEGPAAMCFIPKLKRKRVIVTIHGLDWARAKWGRFASNYIKFGERQAVKHADEIIVLSRNMQEYFLKKYNRKTVLIPNGISRPVLREAYEITKLWGLKKNEYILFLGRIVPEKGISYLLEAWKGLKTEKKLVIVGGSSDTEEFFSEMKKLASPDVIFTGFQQGTILEEFYSNAYLYCLPSDLEGMPLSLLEAMSYGNCCVVSDIPECTEVVEDRAFLFPHGNVLELRKLLRKLLKDEKLVKNYKEKAADYICEKYDWDRVVEKTLEIYRG